ncbi:MAG: serine hydrolase [Bacteroidales bacterium]|nr:serine hydrolase [Bacteroidales bacterium]
MGKTHKSSNPASKNLSIGIWQISRYIGVFLIGVLFTYLIINPESGNAKSKRNKAKKTIYQTIAPAAKPQNKGDKPFLNPLIDNEIYHQMNRSYISQIEDRVNEFIRSESMRQKIQIAVYFRDLNTDKFFVIGDEIKFGPASLMKVPTMIAAFKKEEENSGFLDQKSVFKGSREQDFLKKEEIVGTSSTSLVSGKEYSVLELIDKMITQSDNEATIMLLDLISLEYIEKVERDLGFFKEANTQRNDEIMTIRKYSSFFRTLYNASYLTKYHSNMALEFLSKSDYRLGLKRLLQPNVVMSHKFGSYYHFDQSSQVENQQLHHFGLVYFPNKPYILGVMTKSANQKIGEELIAQISAITYNEVEKIVRNHQSTISLDIE